MRMDRRKIFVILTTILCSAAFVLPGSQYVLAQSERARIIGTVSDPQGAVLPGARVTVTNVATGIATQTTSDRDGYYQALELPIGTYKVKVEHEGFKTVETEAYRL